MQHSRFPLESTEQLCAENAQWRADSGVEFLRPHERLPPPTLQQQRQSIGAAPIPGGAKTTERPAHCSSHLMLASVQGECV